jgi:hypothetical protein
MQYFILKCRRLRYLECANILGRKLKAEEKRTIDAAAALLPVGVFIDKINMFLHFLHL